MKLKITVQGATYEVDVEIVGESEYAAAVPTVMVPARQPAIQAPAAAVAPKAAIKHAPVAGNAIASPVAGTIVALKCKVGDKVTFGQPLLLIEAMKMETTIASDRDGVVTAVCVSSGEAVREGQALVEFA
ncbi:MAG: hypothetical protein LBV09_02880 [Deferribacteraceae bacterium]|jgi:biotin carboxyl carrier protein|nr:hypothetical protein [Deferribacteraceae bacterium]